MPQRRHPFFANQKIAALYCNAPLEQVRGLLHFRGTYRLERTTIHGVEWRYIDGGQGPAAILLFTGALAIAESSWQTISYLAERDEGLRYRVIAPSYPASISNLDNLLGGVANILDERGIERAHILGSSAGGYLAQAFVRRYPARVDKLIISHAGPPDSKRGRQILQALRWMQLLPCPLLRTIFLQRMQTLLPVSTPGTAVPEVIFMRAYLREVARLHLTKQGLLNLYRIMADLDLHHTFTPGDLTDWPGEVLLVMADDDPGVPVPTRQAVQALYPQARLHLFHGTGHLSALLARDEYLAVVDEFLAGPGAPAASAL